MRRFLIFIFILLSCVVIPAAAFGEVVDLIQLGDTTHAYTGGNGPSSIDGDWGTSQSASYSGTDGGGSCSVTSEHIFSQVNDIIRLKYRFRVHAFDDGHYDRHRSYSVYIETRDTSGNWAKVDETHRAASAGGSGSLDYDSGELELAVNIDDVIGIRAVASAGSDAAGGEGRFDGYAQIYEVQAFGGPNIVMPPSTAYADLIQLADTVHAYSGGNGPSSIDGDWATSQSASYSGTDGGGSCSVTSEHIFSQACDVIMIKYRFIVHAFDDGHYDRHRSYSVYIATRDRSGNWTNIIETSRAASAGGSGSLDYDSGEVELAVNIDDVVGIRAVASAGSDAAGGEGRFDGYARIYEVQAFGKYYKDIGIRIKHNTEIIKIGAGDLNDNTHKLRIRKGDTTYGIPLLERDHDDASPILIYDGNQIKALAEIKQ